VDVLSWRNNCRSDVGNFEWLMKVERLFGFKQLSINIKIKRDSVSISDRRSVTVNKPIFLSGGHRDVFESALKAGV